MKYRLVLSHVKRLCSKVVLILIMLIRNTRYAHDVMAYDVMAAILVFQNNEVAAMLVYQTTSFLKFGTHDATSRRDQSQGLVASCVPTFM